MESCLHGAAASMVGHSGQGYSLDRHVTKPGLWFMGQFCVGSDAASTPLPLPWALMGYAKCPFSEHFSGCKKNKLFYETKKGQ